MTVLNLIQMLIKRGLLFFHIGVPLKWITFISVNKLSYIRDRLSGVEHF